MKQTLEIKIEVPDGYKAVFNEAEECIECVKIGFPKTWNEFCEQNPVKEGECLISEYSEILYAIEKGRDNTDSKALLPNKATAEAFLALIQLIQLRDFYRQGWIPDWKDGDAKKHCITTFENEIHKDHYWCGNKILSFPIEEIRDEFLENFRDLIEQAKNLL